MARKKLYANNAERQAAYRAKRDADPQRKSRHRETEKITYVSKKQSGKLLVIENMTDRERRRKRKDWQRASRRYRMKRKREGGATEMTPSGTPVPGPSGAQESANKRVGRKRVNKDRAKCYRRLEQKEEELLKERRKRYRAEKRFQRLRKSVKTPLTPRSKTRSLLRHLESSKPIIKRNLEAHFAMKDNLKDLYRNARTQLEKQRIRNLTCGRIIKKYRMQVRARKMLGLPLEAARERKYAKASVYAEAVKKTVKEFFERDDNSRMTTGKKQTLTRRGDKKQKRFLNDTIKVVYDKFCAEKPDVKVSYSLFARLKPFWVVQPSLSDRETCQCKLHENLLFCHVGLVRHGIIVPTLSLEAYADAIVCDPKAKACMYSTCVECADTSIYIDDVYRTTKSKIVQVPQWVNKADENGYTITSKEFMNLTIAELVEQHKTTMPRFRKHQFNIRNQYAVYRKIREEQVDGDVLIHIDFAENYVCRYAEEIQSVHFGGSHDQATLHTGVAYVNKHVAPFCTISNSKVHGPEAIWTYLSPVFPWLEQQVPQGIRRLNVFSDGPVTQYRQKKNFFAFCQLREHLPHVEEASWHFFEAAHGKGAPDGIGGALKRTADRMVSQGRDIRSARDMYDTLDTETTVKLFYVASTDVQASQKRWEGINLPAVPGTMATHQFTPVIGASAPTITYRDVSCLCARTTQCQCAPPKVFTFPEIVLHTNVSDAAKTSAGAAKTSVPAAKTSVPAAKTSAATAKTSAAAAKTSVPASKASAAAAKTSVPAAKASAAAAKTSVPVAKASAAAAKTSVPAAKTSATAANTSTGAAKTSVPAAKTSATAAKTSAGAANISAAAAKTPAPAAKAFAATTEAPSTSKEVSTPVVAVTDEVKHGLTPITRLDNIQGRYCLVRYEMKVYPGAILDTDENSIQVSCMHRIGKNKYYWPPSILPDICWYPVEDVIGIMNMPPQQIGSSANYSMETDIFATYF